MACYTKILLGLLPIALALLYEYVHRQQRYDFISNDIKDSYDYIIVGGGSAGSVLAARLSEDVGTTVLLLEAGGHFNENPLTHVPMGSVALLQTEYDWDYYTETQAQAFQGLKDNKGYFPRGRILGGSGILNGMQYTRGSRFDFDEWAADGCDGWSYADVLPYFLKSEDIQIDRLKKSPYHNVGGPIAVSSKEPSDLTEYFLKAGQELGYNVTDYNGNNQEGFSVAQSNIRHGLRSSTAYEYLGKTPKRENLDIAIRTFVTKVDIRNKKANGVFYIHQNRKGYVSAKKEVILSAGSINSPQILMLSGIGPRMDLENIGIKVIEDLPVGTHLKDHQLVILPSSISKPYGMTKDRIMNWWNQMQYDWLKTGPLSGTLIDGSAFLHINKSTQGKAYPDIQMIFFNYLISEDFNIMKFNDDLLKGYFAPDPNMHGFSTDVCLTHPHSTGSVRLRSPDPFDYPIIDPQFFADKRDIINMISGIRIWEQLTETKAFKELGVDLNQLKVPFCSAYVFRSDEFWECFIRHVGVTEYHPCCTCKMGGDRDPLAVVDPQLRVKGIDGLRVVDASAFHNITSGNIHAPVVMLAEKAADLIRGKDTVQTLREKVRDLFTKISE